MITSLLLNKREEKYLSWEEYKKKVIEIEVIHMIESFLGENSNLNYNNLENIKVIRRKIGGGKDEGRNLLK